jgi:hypothetical protein
VHNGTLAAASEWARVEFGIDSPEDGDGEEASVHNKKPSKLILESHGGGHFLLPEAVDRRPHGVMKEAIRQLVKKQWCE